jgi:hypothetical protein
MPDITRVNGTWSDGSPLTAETYTKETFQTGRVAGFDGSTKGGLEIINGQLDFDGNFDGNQTITAEYIRRESFTEGPHVSGFRQGRDVWYKSVFPDLKPTKTPYIIDQARAILACTYRIQNAINTQGRISPVGSLLVDINMDYTMASDQNLRDEALSSEPVLDNPPFRGFLGVWLDDYFYKPSATPIVAGRCSTVEPALGATAQYFNRGDSPDFRTFSMRFRISDEDTSSIAALDTFLNPGWHSISVRVSSRQTIRIHGGAIIVTPIR